MRINWVFPPQTSHFSEGKSGKVRLRSSQGAQPVELQAPAGNDARDPPMERRSVRLAAVVLSSVGILCGTAWLIPTEVGTTIT